MKTKIFLLFIFGIALLTFPVKAQVQIGDGTSGGYSPIIPYYNYSYTQVIYYASEINTSGTITKLKWKFTGSISNATNWTIYLGHTPRVIFLSGEDWIDVSTLTKVWEGSFTEPDPGWVTFDITDWDYNGTDNIVVAVDENKPDKNSYSSKFYCTNESDYYNYRTIYYYSNTHNPYPPNPKTGGIYAQYANIIFDGLTPCEVPTEQHEVNVTSSSADLTWTSSGTKWEIEWDTAGFAIGTGHKIITTTKPYQITGLSANTHYEWYIRNICGDGDTSVRTEVKRFCTPVPLPWTENFETTSANEIPFCMAKEGAWGTNINLSMARSGLKYVNENNTDEGWLFSPPFTLSAGTSYDFSFWYYINMSPTDTFEVKYGTAQISDSMKWALGSAITNHNSSGYERFRESFTPSATQTYYMGIRIKRSGYYYIQRIDDMVFETTPTCYPPVSQTEDSIKLNAAKLKWAKGGSESQWHFSIGLEGFDNTSSSYTVCNDTCITVDTLKASKTYDWYVRSSCGSGNYSVWTGPWRFNTTNGKATGPDPASGSYNVDYTDDTLRWKPVENANKYLISLGTSWSSYNLVSDSSVSDTMFVYGSDWDYEKYYRWKVNTVYNNLADSVTGSSWYFTSGCGTYTPTYKEIFGGAERCWEEARGRLKPNTTLNSTYSYWTSGYFGNNYSNSRCTYLNIQSYYVNEWKISPSVDLSGGNYQLEFDLALTKQSNSDPDTLGTDDTLAVVISTDNGATWSLNDTLRVWTHEDFISNTGEHIIIDLSSYHTVIKIGFYGVSTVTNKNVNVYVDNFIIRKPPACPDPSNQEVDNTTVKSGKLHWKEEGSSTQWNVRIVGSGVDTTGVAYYTVNNDTFLVVDTLNRFTTYDWYVRSHCTGGSYGDWIGPDVFSTRRGNALNPYPANAARGVKVTADTLKWGKVTYATKYLLNIGSYYGANDILANFSVTDTVYVKGSNWNYKTKYYWYVNTLLSTTSDTVPGDNWHFSTECLPVNPPYLESFREASSSSFPLCMVVEDADNDGNKWMVNNYGDVQNACIQMNSSSDTCNDWFFTRGINLTGGVTYELDFIYKIQYLNNPVKLHVYWGTGQSSALMGSTAIYSNNNLVSTGWIPQSGTFTPSTSGVYYIGFYTNSLKGTTYLCIDDIQITASNATTMWTGATDTCWFDNNNWTNGVPGYYTSVTIPSGKSNYPEITGTAYCKELYVKSDAAGDASLTGTQYLNINTGTAHVERYIATDSVWHEVSAMTSSSTASSYFFNHSPDVWMTQYVESSDSRSPIVDTNTAMPFGKGFEIWVKTGTVTANFLGALKTVDIELNTTSSGMSLAFSDTAHGYNLLGNPFVSAVKWDASVWDACNIDDQVWLWDPATGNYKIYISGTGAGGLTNGIIPLGQGFFIHSNSYLPEMLIPLAAQVNSSQSFYKSTGVKPTLPHIVVTASKGQKNDEVWIMFHEGSLPAFENGYDGRKLEGSKTSPQLYTVENNEKLSIDVLSPVQKDIPLIVPLFFKAGETGMQTITMKAIEQLSDVTVTLEDLKLGKSQILNDNPVYTFFATDYQNPDRFRVRFDRGIITNTNDIKETKQSLYAYTYQKNIYVVSYDKTIYQKKLLTVYDMTGRRLISRVIPPGDVITIPLHLSNTYITISVVGNSEVYTTKAFIK